MPRTELNIQSVQPATFAPHHDTVMITYDPNNPRRFDGYELEITDRNGNVVYLAQFDGARVAHAWSGRGDAAAPQNPQRFVNPLDGPYRIRFYGVTNAPGPGARAAFVHFFDSVGTSLSSLVAPRAPVPTVKTVNVLYHSIELSLGDWLPAEQLAVVNQAMDAYRGANFAAAPAADANVILWVWYKLGKLGYFPGPHPGAPAAMNGALRLAILRYRQSRPTLHQRLFEYNAGAPRINAVVDTALRSITADLLVALDADQGNRTDFAGAAAAAILDDADVIRDSTHDSKLFLDADRFYISLSNEFEHDLKCAVERDWLPRPMVPVRAKVKLQDSAGNAVDPPYGAAGDFRVKWEWSDVATPDGTLPVAAPNKPSRTKQYVALATQRMSAATVSTYHGARAAAGGLITGNAGNDAVAALQECLPYASAQLPTGLHTRPLLDPNAPSASGQTTVFLRTSILAGDTYKLKATLDLTGAHATVQAAHVGVAAALTKSTGTFTLWRRIPIAALVRWGNTPAIASWDPVIAYFAHAFVKLLPPVRTFQLSALGGPDILALKTAYENVTQAVDRSWFTPHEDPNVATVHAELSPDFMFPFDPRGIELRRLLANGAAQLSSPVNVINDVMIGSFAWALKKWRRAQMGGAPTSQMKPRFAMLALWADGARPAWLQRVAAYFDVQYRLLFNPAAAMGGSCIAATDRSKRCLTPLPHNDGGLGGLPASRIDILNEMILGPLAGLNYAANQAAVRGFVRQLKSDMDSRDGKPPEETGFTSAMHPTLERIVACYADFAKAGPAPAGAPPAHGALDAEIEADDNRRYLRAVTSVGIWDVRDRVNTLSGSLFDKISEQLYDVARLPGAPGTRPASGLTVIYYRAHDKPHQMLRTGAPNQLDETSYGTSIGLDDGVCVACADLPMNKEHLLAHEMAHCLFLQHWQKAQDTILDGFSKQDDHDLADANCIMSYPDWDSASLHGPRDPCSSHYKNDVYDPQFCGKCNLKLRGWDIKAANMPASSAAITLVEPMEAWPNAAGIPLAEPVALQTAAEDFLTNVLGVAVHRPMSLNHTTLKLLGNPALQVNAGVAGFDWASVNAVDPMNGNGAIATLNAPYRVVGGTSAGGPARQSAVIPTAANGDYSSAWEKNHEFGFINGGATNLDPASLTGGQMVLNAHHPLSSPDVLVHEVMHIYQVWDDVGKLQEGMTELFALMLSHRSYGTVGHLAAGLFTKLNPSYIMFAHFVVEELLPRVGIDAIAQVYFSGTEAALQPALRAGVDLQTFKKACEAIYKDHNPAPATALLGAVPGHRPAAAIAAADTLADLSVTSLRQFIDGRAAGLGLGGKPRVLIARGIRVNNVITAYNRAIQSAEGFRNQVTVTDRIHRLEPWIQETKTQVLKLRDKMPV